MFTGGAFSRASIFALGIMPYISASIIIQLMSIAVPAVQKMQQEGESGRKKITQYTRFLTIAISLVQAPGYLASTVVSAVAVPDTLWWFSSVVIIVSSTLVIMWLGERITDNGVGNGQGEGVNLEDERPMQVEHGDLDQKRHNYWQNTQKLIWLVLLDQQE